MLDKFTEKAIKGIIIAQEEAKKVSLNKIGTEHLLLGLMQEGTSIPLRVLKAVGMTIDGLRSQIEKNATRLNEDQEEGISFSYNAIKAIRMAKEKAESFGYIYVGSEHLFIALLSDDNYNSVKILNELGVDLDRMKETATRITTKQSVNRAHPEIRSSKKLTEISKAMHSKLYDVPFNLEDIETIDVMNSAKEESITKNSDTIGTEHILMALVQSENIILNEVLSLEGITYDKVNNSLTSHTDRVSEYQGLIYKLTPAAHTILMKAYEISVELGSGKVKPEHVLLGLLKQDIGLAHDLLKDLAINPKSLYQKVSEPIEKQNLTGLKIIKLAQDESRRLEYNVLGTEHILVALLSMASGGVAYNVLKSLGLKIQEVREEIIKQLGYGTANPFSDLAFTPRAKKLVELAWNEAKKMNKSNIKSEHLLLAITRIPDCFAMKVLESLGVDAIEIKQGIYSALESLEEN